MSLKNFVPTDIVDQPGNFYTKPVIHAASKMLATPAAQKSVDLSMTELLDGHDAAVKILTDHVAVSTNITVPSVLRMTRKMIEKYPADLVQQLADAVSDNTLSYTVTCLVSYGLDSTTIREARCFSEHLPQYGVHFAQIMIRSLRHYPQLPKHPDYSTADETTKNQCIALMIATDTIHNGIKNVEEKYELLKSQQDATGEPIMLLDGDGLIELLMDKPDQAQQIADLIVARKTGNGDLIRDILNHETPALADGLL